MIFYKCNFDFLPDISKWKLTIVKDNIIKDIFTSLSPYNSENNSIFNSKSNSSINEQLSNYFSEINLIKDKSINEYNIINEEEFKSNSEEYNYDNF